MYFISSDQKSDNLVL